MTEDPTPPDNANFTDSTICTMEISYGQGPCDEYYVPPNEGGKCPEDHRFIDEMTGCIPEGLTQPPVTPQLPLELPCDEPGHELVDGECLDLRDDEGVPSDDENPPPIDCAIRGGCGGGNDDNDMMVMVAIAEEEVMMMVAIAAMKIMKRMAIRLQVSTYWLSHHFSSAFIRKILIQLCPTSITKANRDCHNNIAWNMKVEVEKLELSTIVASLGKSRHYFECVRNDQSTADVVL